LVTRCGANGEAGNGGDEAIEVLSLGAPMNTTQSIIRKLSFKPKYSVHGFKVSSNLEGGGKKGKDGSFVLTSNSQ
jgi:hypothetical protein